MVKPTALNKELIAYIEQLNLSKALSKDFLVFREVFNALFYNNNAFEKILEKVHLLKIEEDDTKDVSLLPLAAKAEGYFNIYVTSKNCPYLFAYLDLPYVNSFGLVRITAETPIESYCLSANQRGELSFTVFFQDGDAKLFNAKNNGAAFFINLLLILIKILSENKDKKLIAAAAKIEQKVKANHASTFANVFAFVKEHPQVTSSFYNSLVDYETSVQSAAKYSEAIKFGDGNYILPDSFMVKNKYETIPYLLKAKAEGIYLEMDCESWQVSSYRFENFGEAFPFRLVFTKAGVEALYLSNVAYNRRASRKRSKKPLKSPLPKTANILISGEAKLEELVQLQKTADLSNFKAFYEHNPWQNAILQTMTPPNISVAEWLKNISEKDLEKFKQLAIAELKANLAQVLTAAKEEIATVAVPRILENQKKELEKIETLVLPLQQKANEITTFLTRVYAHEILLGEI